MKHLYSSTELQLLRAKASGFLLPHQKRRTYNHAHLPKDVDMCLAYGVLKYGHDENLLGDLSDAVYAAFSKCLGICMENFPNSNDEDCEICESLIDFAKHSMACTGHPEACSYCKSLFNIIGYHLSSCKNCDMHLCTKLKLKLLKYNWTVSSGLVELWPKIQQYISRLFPDISIPYKPIVNSSPTSSLQRYPSVFDSGSTPPMSPVSVVARGLDDDQVICTQPPSLIMSPFAQGGLHCGSNFPASSGFPGSYPSVPYLGFQQLNMNPDQGLPESGNNMEHENPGGNEPSLKCASIIDSFVEPKHLGKSDGRGAVIMGEPRQLRKLSDLWVDLKRNLQHSICELTDLPDGVILNGKNSGMTVVDGCYEKGKHWTKVMYLGKGVAGKVHLGVDGATQCQFAVKKIELVKYLGEEIDVWSELEHPNIMQLFGAMRVKHKIYIFCELYAAGNMEEFIKEQRMLDQWISLWFLQQLLDVLVYLKQKGILHEDIKADNILLKPDSFQIGLGDFGLSRRGPCPPRTPPVGGQHQWSPEKAKSVGHSYPSDVWALNCAFVHMLSGEPVWLSRFSSIPFLHYTIGNHSPPLDDIPKNLLEPVDALIRRAWTLDPALRPEAAHLLDDEAFDLLNFDYRAIEFRSHIPTVEEQEEQMEVGACESVESHLSLDRILHGMEDESQAAEYINSLITSIRDEDPELKEDGSTATQNVAQANKWQLESIQEEPSGTEKLDEHEKRNRKVTLPPLTITKNDSNKRHELVRSKTSPSVESPGSSGINTPRSSLIKQGSSPAILVSGGSTERELESEPSIFDLNSTKGGSSGYITGPVDYSYMDNSSASMSLNMQQMSDFPSVFGSSFNSTMPEHSSNGGFMMSSGIGAETNDMPFFPATNDIKMGEINLNDAMDVEPSFNFMSQMKEMKELVSSHYVPEPPVVTIVNGDSRLDYVEVLIPNSGCWRQIVEASMVKIKDWNMDCYTLYDGEDKEIDLDALAPYEKCCIYAFPCRENSHWYVANGRILHR